LRRTTQPSAFSIPAIEEIEYYDTDRQMYAHRQVMYSMTVDGQNMRLGQCPGMYAPMITSNAGGAIVYGVISGDQWAEQPASTYAGHPKYTDAWLYGGYYGSGS
jgi:hypothetical protein